MEEILKPLSESRPLRATASHSQSELGRRLKKGVATLRREGPAALFRQAVYSFYFHRYEQRRNRIPTAPGPAQTLVELWGREFELPASSAGIAEELRLFGVHEPLATAVYRGLLRPDDQVIDIGANVGYYLLVAAQALGTGGRFLAFEPVPTNYAILKRNLDRCDLRSCQAWPWAIGAANEDATFFESHVSNFGGLLPHSRQELKQEITVEVKRLDDVVKTVHGFEPTVLRMDVEGAELLVLAGARGVLSTYKPLLFIEFHPFAIGMDGIMKALTELKSLGYKDGVLIDRLWDQPWIAPWARAGRCWHGTLDSLCERVTSHAYPVFTLIINRPSA